MLSKTNHIVLAEDDEDDSLLFELTLKELPHLTSLNRVHDGVELTHLLEELQSLPDLIFLDMNMPRKNGMQCLFEIRMQSRYDGLPVIIFSTSSNTELIDSAYDSGANLYIQKPSEFRIWKKVISKVLELDWNTHAPHSVKDHFLLSEI